MSAIKIDFASSANQDVVSSHTEDVLSGILTAAKSSSCFITSTSRTPADQARVMFDNIAAHGVAAQKSLYAAAGDAVIDEFVKAKKAGKNSAGIKAAMEAKIITVGPGKVSHHCADPAILNVVDVAPSSIAKKDAFEKAVHAALGKGAVSRFLTPGGGDPAYHLEIPQPRA